MHMQGCDQDKSKQEPMGESRKTGATIGNELQKKKKNL